MLLYIIFHLKSSNFGEYYMQATYCHEELPHFMCLLATYGQKLPFWTEKIYNYPVFVFICILGGAIQLCSSKLNVFSVFENVCKSFSFSCVHLTCAEPRVPESLRTMWINSMCLIRHHVHNSIQHPFLWYNWLNEVLDK